MIAASVAPDPGEDGWESDPVKAARFVLAWWTHGRPAVSFLLLRQAGAAATTQGTAVRLHAFRGAQGVLFVEAKDYCGGTLCYGMADIARLVDDFLQLVLADDFAAPSRRIAEEVWNHAARAQAQREHGR